MTGRWAIYLAPAPDGLLWRRAAAWLGRDPCRGPLEQVPPPPGLAASRFAAATASPRRYGFHGTLKPPFALAAGRDEAALCAAVAALALRLEPFDLPPLRVGSLGGFVALLPSTPCPALAALAARCVVELDGFRAPAGEAELGRRRQAGLDAEEEALLQRWGYPYVLQRFRFHMTLSGRLESAERDALMAAAAEHFAAALVQPLRCDALSLFHQPGPGESFRLRQRFAVGRAAGEEGAGKEREEGRPALG